MASHKYLAKAMKRLSDEMRTYHNVENKTFLYLRPINADDMLLWEAVLKGPDDTPYEGGLWHLSIEMPQNYPLAPPTIHFTTKIIHPNIDFKNGKICFSLLDEEWSAVMTLQTTLEALQWLLTYPNPDSPLNVDISVLLRKGDMVGYESVVRYLTEEMRLAEAQNLVR
ncbi:Ubiquitin-conjugating enzyme/RWD-like [Penicillium camemberti]|uniref:Ubiquitin-conjugating enzyme/RWD-like n=1 Tax=Penicillium camemberti (strain FM 013) TaxID=1429867 RepID=A0A0G4PWC9_PENC3|nr:Ubiquitin-conjugating enzyme/RWD-like [Penicillium camemberti]